MTRPFTATFTRLNINFSDLRIIDNGEQKKFHLSNSHLIGDTFNDRHEVDVVFTFSHFQVRLRGLRSLDGDTRELPDMKSASELGHGKADVVRKVT